MGRAQRSESTIKIGKVLQSISIPARRPDGTRILNRPTLAKVAQVVANFTDHQTGSGAHPSLSTVADLVQISSRTVQRAFQTLEALGVLRMVKAHSWRLHRPTTWAFTADTIDRCLSASIAAAKERSAKYWARLRAFQEARQSRVSPSGRQGVHLPSPLRGGREEKGGPGGARPPDNPLFSVLSALKEGRFVNLAT